jgi:hypothetical protein
MTYPDPQFARWTVADTIGSFVAALAVLIACAAQEAICRKIVRWRASKLPKNPSSGRAEEELEAIVSQMTWDERVQLAANLILNSGELRAELQQERQHADGELNLSGIRANLRDVCSKMESTLDHSRASARGIAVSSANLAAELTELQFRSSNHRAPEIDSASENERAKLRGHIVWLIQSRAKWVSLVSEVRRAALWIAAINLATGNPSLSITAVSKRRELKCLLKNEEELMTEFVHVLNRIDERRNSPAPTQEGPESL